ncbi:hypothetical protein HMPREF0063_12627 [Aeromicrobium marinum DSM 15272]|uniref:Uncharacterized protein n=1 Tax=Aeromicrobium marinum DSM 15272 TaxID=585531 RepID=E2SF18_9ACTN|nr:hypothetical protein [Aeromicrobium marinum]EFQ82262.1 hypothetical protein HMPREF0063_12627 [Aeromicrobium marinum DSM 15272]
MTDELSDLLAAALSQADPTIARRLGPDPQAHLDLVVLTARATERMSDLLRSSVAAARAAGWSWEAIGSALGMSRQAAQQRFGSKEDVPEDSAVRRRLVGMTAFTEMDVLEEWGRHGWRSVAAGPGYHDIERDEVQWEHHRAVVGSRQVAALERDGWQRVGGTWFPWIYLVRPLPEPAVPGEPT